MENYHNLVNHTPYSRALASALGRCVENYHDHTPYSRALASALGRCVEHYDNLVNHTPYSRALASALGRCVENSNTHTPLFAGPSLCAGSLCGKCTKEACRDLDLQTATILRPAYPLKWVALCVSSLYGDVARA